jgi:hypothetical protein
MRSWAHEMGSVDLARTFDWILLDLGRVVLREQIIYSNCVVGPVEWKLLFELKCVGVFNFFLAPRYILNIEEENNTRYREVRQK